MSCAGGGHICVHLCQLTSPLPVSRANFVSGVFPGTHWGSCEQCLCVYERVLRGLALVC